MRPSLPLPPHRGGGVLAIIRNEIELPENTRRGGERGGAPPGALGTVDRRARSRHPCTATLACVTFDTSGVITAAEALVSGHRTLRVLAADLAGDGSGYVIVGVSQPLALPSGRELPGGTSVLHIAADGSAPPRVER